MGKQPRVCFMCDSVMEEKDVLTTTGWGDFLTTVTAKAWVCPTCGQKVFSAEEVDRLQELGQRLAQEAKEQRR